MPHHGSMNFPFEPDEILGVIALQNKASVVWIICEAAERHVPEQGPLMATEKGELYEIHR